MLVCGFKTVKNLQGKGPGNEVRMETSGGTLMEFNVSDSLVKVDIVDFPLWWFVRKVLCHTAHFSSCAFVLTVIDLIDD